ncbi:enoyl-CoA hydratase/isomerase family protein [Puniceibacterium sediminis]|uniref:3-hydroxyisobutyryl-CoA hydrolase n=1 Tax=Puniceibacterium sediminis TaxID=1608407 RepID=A0A238ZRL5_9RHOB|nr:enoyl-CoA hydratase/isomerase family protein [Puniceibacterium sediminis]SNR85980.1 Enoyl-CoA hydratase/carnithine racemase [Puniceibacterium sediminis]
MPDLSIRTTGRAGRITLTRAKALNALTYDMCTQIESVLLDWRSDPAVDLVVIDAEGDRAFCAGGDIAELYAAGMAGNFTYGQTFWHDEYRLNALIAEYPKPIVSLMQGFTMGGGVGLGCHASHRIVCESSQIAMPECGIGLVPDVGGTFLLARAPGQLGAYLGLTAARMGPADAILAGFADIYIPQDCWPELVATLESDAVINALQRASRVPPQGDMSALLPQVDAHFAGEHLSDVVDALRSADTAFAADTLKKIERNAPLSMACTLEILQRLSQGTPTIRTALELEYRFTYRALEQGDLLEGIRAAIIDKDRKPVWKHAIDAVPQTDTTRMLHPLQGAKLDFHEETQP